MYIIEPKQMKIRRMFHIMTLAVSSQSLSFNYINCSVVQGFPALRKAIITQVKKYDNFPRVCNHQSATDT